MRVVVTCEAMGLTSVGTGIVYWIDVDVAIVSRVYLDFKEQLRVSKLDPGGHLGYPDRRRILSGKAAYLRFHVTEPSTM